MAESHCNTANRRSPSSLPRNLLVCPQAVAPKSWAFLLVTTLLLTGVTAPAWGDIVVLKSGKRLEGDVIASDETSVQLKLRGGKVTLQRSEIASIEHTPSVAEELAEREAALPDSDAFALYRLAEWCRTKGLRKDAKRLTWQVLDLDTDHAKAREDLGFKKLGAIWLTEEDWHHRKGEVKHLGQWIPREKWQELQRRAHTVEKLQHAQKLFRTAARQGDLEKRQAALDELHGLPQTVRAWTLLKGTESLNWRDRQFAIRELAILDRTYTKHVAHVAITDRKRSVRDEALRTLQQWNHPDTALSFLPHLRSTNDGHRVNAARALNIFPDPRATGTLITTLSKTWAGFGRANFSSLTQRAYIKDYELVSGGTGLVVQEVADPVVDTFVEGVVLDIAIRRVEAVQRIAALQKITGQKFGMNFDQWQDWWAQNKGKRSKSQPEKASS